MRRKPPKTNDTNAGRGRRSTAATSRTEQELLDANQRLKSILIANEVATWTWDVARDVVVGDENLGRLFGVAANTQAPIQVYLDVMHPEDRPAVAAAIAAAVQGPEDKYEVDYRVVRKDGSISWLSARGKVERDLGGKASYFPGVVVDITERKNSEQKADDLSLRLKQQASLFDITLSSISDFAYIFDREGRFVFVNQALLDLWGLKLEEAVGKNFYDLKYPEELAARLQRQIREVFDGGTGVRDETPYTSPTGAGGYYEYIFRPVFGREGRVEAVAGSTREITERKRVEEELRQSQERFRVLAETLESQVKARTAELEERNKDISKQAEQLRSLSVSLMEAQDREGRQIARELHDSAGQVVVALLMRLWTMVEKLRTSNPELVNLAEEIRGYAEEVDRELRTTSYLLHPPMLEEVGLKGALRWYADGLEQRAGIAAELQVPENFERQSGEMEIALFRVVQECLNNIHRHSGSKTAQIRLGREGSNLVVEVRDAGRGMAADKLAELGEGRIGVGLRGVRERVRPFMGEVRIESTEGKGTTVLVTLPLPTAGPAAIAGLTEDEGDER